MAVLAVLGFGALGAGIGSATGIGISAGWVIGTTVGRILFPAQGATIEREGPRLGDLTVSSSSWGAPIPIAYGTVRLAGNMIWALPLNETSVTESQETGGKGGGGTTIETTSFFYSTSFAMAFAQGRPAHALLRIWGDGKLLYDIRDPQNAIIVDWLRFKFYKGDEIQLPDAAIEADKGVGNVPPHRGMTYIVFTDFRLEDFGNRVPNITAEINFEGVAYNAPVDIPITMEGPSDATSQMAIDYDHNVLWIRKDSDPDVVIGYDIVTNQEIKRFFVDNNFRIEGILPRSGWLLVSHGEGGASVMDPITGTVIRTNPSLDWSGAPRTAGTTPDGSPLDGSFYVSDGSGDFEVVPFDLQPIIDSRTPTGTVHTKAFNGPAGEIWWLELTSTTLALYRAIPQIELVATLVPADFSATSFVTSGGWPSEYVPAFDPVVNNILIYLTLNTGDIFFAFNAVTHDIRWIQDDPSIFQPLGIISKYNNLNGTVYGYRSISTIMLLNVVDGTIEASASINPSEGSGLESSWNVETFKVWDNKSSTQIRTVSIAGSLGTILVGNVIEDISNRVGYNVTTDIDASTAKNPLLHTVRGYVISRSTPARDAIFPLLILYFLDFVESDYKLKTVRRNKTLTTTLEEDNFAVNLTRDRKESWKENRVLESELPMRFTITYIDVDNDYQQNSQYQKRHRRPIAAVLSDNEVNLTVPIVFQAVEAKARAEKLLFINWIERVSYDINLPWDYLYLDPADAVTLEFNDGRSVRVRFVQHNIGVNYGAESSLIYEEPHQYDPIFQISAEGSSGAGGEEGTSGVGETPGQVLDQLILSEAFFLDIPLLRDQDAPSDEYIKMHLALVSMSQGSWNGALAYEMIEHLGAGELVGINTLTPAWGYTTTALGDPTSPWRLDKENTVNVRMVVGESRLNSISDPQLRFGSNAAALIKHNGEIEIIQFRTVTEVGSPEYTLSELLRGRRGTDTMAYDHASGEIIVLLHSLEINQYEIPLSKLNVEQEYLVVTQGQLIADGKNYLVTSQGRSLMPYAPHDWRATVDGSDIDFTWIRRTRIGGELRDGTGTVPLSEDTESYEVDIYDGSSVVRTLSSSTETVTYTSAQITTDFGSIPTTIKIAIYQLSAQVGRGFSRAITIPVIGA